MEATKVGVLVTVLVLVAGLGMYILEGSYSGALVTSGDRQCEETENLFPDSDGDLKQEQSIFKKGGTKTKVGTAPWSQLIPETCFNNVLAERYCLTTGDATSESVTCVNGCASGGMTGGKCKLPPCSDSDNGQNYQTAGTTTGLMLTDGRALGVPPVTQSAQTYTDLCVPNSNIISEFYCYSAGQGNYEVKAVNYTCTSLGSYACQSGRCVSTVEICDGIDNDNDGQMDEGCDDDNDDYCDKTITRATSYSCSGSDNCCPLGGGDCADHIKTTNPSMIEDCFDLYNDNNCDGQNNEGCTGPYYCNDDDITNDPAFGGTVTLTAASGQSKIIIDFCKNENLLNQSLCYLSQSNYGTNLLGSVSIGCACVGSDSLSGTTPAVCS